MLAVSSLPLHYQWQFSNTVWIDLSGETNTTLLFTNLQPADDGLYRVQVSTTAKTNFSRSGVVETMQKPIIAAQSPELELRRAQGQGATLTVTITNPGARALTFLWFKDGAPAVRPSFGPAYGIPFTRTNDEGSYQVIVTNRAGAATSLVWHASVTLRGEATLWGDDAYGQISHGRSRQETNLVAISAGAFHTLGLRENGTVIAWGDNTGGQTNVPAGLSNVVAVAGGDLHSLALLDNGTVRAWGQNASGQTNVPGGLTNVTAIAAGGVQSLALRRDGTLVAWGGTFVPAGVSNVATISAGWNHALAVLSNGTVQAWQEPGYSYFTPPAGLSNIVATASGSFHALALKKDGTVAGWGQSAHGETNSPAGLSNVMRLAAGEETSLALRNDGTVFAWGRNEAGQTNVALGLTNVCAIASGWKFNVALAYNEALEYPVSAQEDLLLIYSTNSPESTFVKDYYLAHRPMAGQANVLGVPCRALETVSRTTYTNALREPILTWLAANPTKRPKYWVLFFDLPARLNEITNRHQICYYDTNGALVYCEPQDYSVSHELSQIPGARNPFITHLNMDGTNDCRAYIDKLAHFGSNYSPGQLVISARRGGYGNTNYYFDDTRLGYDSPAPAGGFLAKTGVVEGGVPETSVVYSNALDYGFQNHILLATNVSGYLCWGTHSTLGPKYLIPTTNSTSLVRFFDNSGWYLIETVESNNGFRGDVGHGNFLHWYSEESFGGTDFENTPIGAVTHTDEPFLFGINDPGVFFGFWVRGKRFGTCEVPPKEWTGVGEGEKENRLCPRRPKAVPRSTTLSSRSRPCSCSTPAAGRWPRWPASWVSRPGSCVIGRSACSRGWPSNPRPSKPCACAWPSWSARTSPCATSGTF